MSSTEAKGHLKLLFEDPQRLRLERDQAIQREILAHKHLEELDLAYWQHGADGNWAVAVEAWQETCRQV